MGGPPIPRITVIDSIDYLITDIRDFFTDFGYNIENGLYRLVQRLDTAQRFVKKSKFVYDSEKDRIEVHTSKDRMYFLYPVKNNEGKKVYRYPYADE